MDEFNRQLWAEGQNRALRDAIKSAAKGGHSSGGTLGAAAGFGVVALLLGVVLVLALPIIYPSYLAGRLVSDTIHPLIGILAGLGIFAAGLAALYFSRLARAIYAFPFAFVLQLAIFQGVSSSSDMVWASGASLVAALLLYRVAFSVMRLRSEDDAIPAWLVSGALAVVSLAPNFLVAIYAPRDIAPIASTSRQQRLGDQRHAPPTPAPNSGAAFSGMILPQAERRLLAPTDVAHMSADDLRMARNEIFARRGRVFTDPTMRTHFQQFDWYRPTSEEVQLSDVEVANVRFLSEEEERRASRSSEDPLVEAIEPEVAEEGKPTEAEYPVWVRP